MTRATDGTGQRGHTAPRHVWVLHEGTEVPGVLIDWRQRGDLWEAYVSYAYRGPTGSAALVQDWLPGDRVRPN